MTTGGVPRVRLWKAVIYCSRQLKLQFDPYTVERGAVVPMGRPPMGPIEHFFLWITLSRGKRPRVRPSKRDWVRSPKSYAANCRSKSVGSASTVRRAHEKTRAFGLAFLDFADDLEWCYAAIAALLRKVCTDSTLVLSAVAMISDVSPFAVRARIVLSLKIVPVPTSKVSAILFTPTPALSISRALRVSTRCRRGGGRRRVL